MIGRSSGGSSDLRRPDAAPIPLQCSTSDGSKTASRDPAAVRAPHPGVWRLWLSPMRSPGCYSCQSCGKFLESMTSRAGVSSTGCWPTRIARTISGEKRDAQAPPHNRASRQAATPWRRCCHHGPQGTCCGLRSLGRSGRQGRRRSLSRRHCRSPAAHPFQPGEGLR